MCSICLCNPCLSLCPNAPEPRHIECQCGYEIYEGEEHYDYDGTIYCSECKDELLDNFKKTLEFKDEDWGD